MKKTLFLLFFTSFLLANDSCLNLLKEGDKYLQRIPLCDETAEKHALLAKAYFERYNICIKNPELKININPLIDEDYKCDNHK